MKIEAARRLGLQSKYRTQAASVGISESLGKALATHFKEWNLPTPKEYTSIYEFFTFCDKVERSVEDFGVEFSLGTSVQAEWDFDDHKALKKVLGKLNTLGFKFKANSGTPLKVKIPGGIAYTMLNFEAENGDLQLELIPDYDFL